MFTAAFCSFAGVARPPPNAANAFCSAVYTVSLGAGSIEFTVCRSIKPVRELKEYVAVLYQ